MKSTMNKPDAKSSYREWKVFFFFVHVKMVARSLYGHRDALSPYPLPRFLSSRQNLHIFQIGICNAKSSTGKRFCNDFFDLLSLGKFIIIIFPDFFHGSPWNRVRLSNDAPYCLLNHWGGRGGNEKFDVSRWCFNSHSKERLMINKTRKMIALSPPPPPLLIYQKRPCRPSDKRRDSRTFTMEFNPEPPSPFRLKDCLGRFGEIIIDSGYGTARSARRFHIN